MRQMFRLFCNCQQHKYFVLSFVSFCIEKKREKRERVNVSNVFLVPGGLGSKGNRSFAELSCPGEESGVSTLLQRSK